VTEPTEFGFNELHAEERGLLLGLSLQATGDAALSRLASSRRQACCNAWQALRALSRSDRAALLADWIVEARSPFPPGMERLHPSWLAEAIAREPTELWPALLGGLPGVQAVEPLLEFRWEPSEGSLRPSAPHLPHLPARFARPRQTLPRWSAAGDEGAREARGVGGVAGGPEVPAGGAGGLPTRQVHVGSAIATDGETWPPKSVAELQGCVFGRLAPLCAGPSGPLGAGLCRLGCDELLAEIARRGTALQQELRAEGDASLWAVAGRLPATLGRQWVKW
jgi:hypothetical protein